MSRTNYEAVSDYVGDWLHRAQVHAGHPGQGAAGSHAHHARKFFGALQQPELRSASFAVGGFQLEGYAMTLSAFAWNLHADAEETLLLWLPVPAGHGLQLGDVRQRGRQRLRGRHRHLPRHALAGRLEHGTPGLLGAAGRNREAALRSLRRVYPRAGAAVGGHAGPVQHADQGQRLRGRVCLGNGPTGGLAVSCAALTAAGTVAGATLSFTGAVSGSSLSISGAASVGLLSSATGITGSTLTINNTANAGNFTTVGDVSTGTLTARAQRPRRASQPPGRSRAPR